MKKFFQGILISIGILITTVIITTLFIEVVLPSDVRNYSAEKATSEDECVTEVGDIILTGQVKEKETVPGTTTETGEVIWRPVTNGHIMYCIEPKVSLKLGKNDNGSLMYSEDLKDKLPQSSITRTHETDSEGKSGHTDVTSYSNYTTTYYKCVGEDYTEEGINVSSDKQKRGKKFHVIKRANANVNSRVKDYGRVNNLYDVAYIVSYTMDSLKDKDKTKEEWEGEKQQAIWKSVICKIEEIGHTAYTNQGAQILKEGKEYQKVQEEIVENDGKVFQEDLTNKDNIKIDTDTKTKLHKIGPFKLKYVDGDGKELDRRFVGISDMYLLDSNNNKIKIENIIIPEQNPQKGGEHPVYTDHAKLTFFSVTDEEYVDKNGNQIENKNKVDYNSHKKTFPKSEKEFYVEFNYSEDISSLKLHVDFTHLKCTTKICLREGCYGKIEVVEHTDSKPKLGPKKTCGHHISGCRDKNGKIICIHGACTSDCYEDVYRHTCTKTLGITEHTDSQDGIFIGEANRELITEGVDIPFKITPTTTNMKIGGFVFEDVPTGKENLSNGSMDEAGDKKLKNIEVALYEVGTNELATLSTLKAEKGYKNTANNALPQEVKTEINDPKDYTRRTNPTLTDENGYYEFRGVDREKKYYVKFTYNGQTYTCTDYMKYNGTSYSSTLDMLEKLKSANEKTIYESLKVTSKGTEISKQRTNFNDRFATIGSSPNNYEIPEDTLKLIEGQYNETFTTYDLSGITLKSDGNYEQNNSNQLIDTYLNVVNGKIEENNFKEGLISKTIRKYIANDYGDNENHQYPTDIKNQIYNRVVEQVKDKENIWKKLQFIEDCKIHSYSKSASTNDISNYDQYPLYGNFTTYVANGNKYPNNSYENGTYAENSTYKNHNLKASGTGKEFVYVQASKKEKMIVINNPEKQGLENTIMLENIRVIAGDKEDIILPYTYKKAEYNKDTNELILITLNGKKITIRTEEDWYIQIIPYMESNHNVEFKNAYPSQLLINQGLWRRQQVDIALRKDVYKATLTVNGKTQTYKYDSRKQILESDNERLIKLRNECEQLKDTYLKDRTNQEAYNAYVTKKEQLNSELQEQSWDIQGKILDPGYYGEGYNREIYESDYYFPGDENGNNKLKAYVTYKITIRNNSESILAQINEVVEYYDKDYIFVPDKSWMMYTPNNTNSNTVNYEDLTLSDQDFYDIMTGDKKIDSNSGKYRQIVQNNNGQAGSYNGWYENPKASNGSIALRQGDFDDKFANKEYKTLYIGMKDKKILSGEEVYLYLTFQVNGEGENLAKDEITETDLGKHNIAEINNYSTFYRNGTKLPNLPDNTTKGSDDPAGLIDYDSSPGNFTAEYLEEDNYEQYFEDDTDRARSFKVTIKPPEGEDNDDDDMIRKISGTVWEDKRNTPVEGAVIGNGIREPDNSEVKIPGIKVQLLEVKLDENGDVNLVQKHYITNERGQKVLIDTGGVASMIKTNGDKIEYKLAETTTKSDGTYTFEGIVPGDYIVRFTYGGEYNSKYNGQDYKSTSYQVGIDQNGRTDVGKITVENENHKTDKTGYYGYTDVGNYDTQIGENTSGSYGYDIYKADNNASGNVSDAKDLWIDRKNANNYSKGGVLHDLAQDLSNISNGNVPEELKKATTMRAETGVIRFEFEYNRQNSKANTQKNDKGETVKIDNNGYDGTTTGESSYTGKNNSSNNNNNGTYYIENVDLGLEERPKAGLELSKKVTNVQVVLANSNVLFDANETTKDFVFEHKGEYDINNEKEEVRVEEKTGKIYKDYNIYDDFRNNNIQSRVETIIKDGENNKGKGLVNITMDKELMHGATIQITYDMKVTNVGEVDYKDTQFYYLGKIAEGNKGTIVTTSADVVLDYVPNNLQFRKVINDNKWSVEDNPKGKFELNFETEAGGETTEQILEKYKTIIKTTGLDTKLTPNNSTSTQLKLSQLITEQNTDDDLKYENIAEIVQISNDVGRRMAYSVQGNQDPTQMPAEIDSSKSEQVLILPPFGIGEIVTYISLSIGILAIIIVSIIFIKKKVLK